MAWRCRQGIPRFPPALKLPRDMAPPASAQAQVSSRREFLRVGLAGFGGLSWPAILRLQAQAATALSRSPTAVIIVWLRGGCSHLDTYDPKPESGSEYAGPFSPISTKSPGIRLTELLPRQARIADKFALLRSMAHTGGGHPSGSLQLLSGDPDAQDKIVPVYPDVMSVAHYLRRQGHRAAELCRRQSDHAL